MIHVRLRIHRTFDQRQHEHQHGDDDDHYDLLTRAFEDRAQRRAKVRYRRQRGVVDTQVYIVFMNFE
jgi:hypothetical protein